LAGQQADCPHCQQQITLTVPSDWQPYNFWVPKSWLLRIPLLLLHSYLGLIAVVATLSGEIGVGVVILLTGLVIHCALMVCRKVFATIVTGNKSLPSGGNPTISAVLRGVIANRNTLRNFAFGVTALGIIFMVLFGIPDSTAFFGLLWLSVVTGLFLQFSPKFDPQLSPDSTASPKVDWLSPLLNRFSRRKLFRLAGVVSGICLLILITPKLYRGIQEFGQARDPVMRQRTKEAWQQIQSLEVAIAQQGGNPGTRAYLYSQLNLQQVDPKVVSHVVSVVNASREYHQLQETISSEVSAKSRGRAEAAQAVQLFGGLLGLVASGESRSLSEVERNLSAGLASGGFVGNAMSSFQENSMWNDIKNKYGQRIDVYENGIKQFANDRVTLAGELTKKYQEPFMSAY